MKIQSKLETIYATAKVCDVQSTNKCFELEPNLKEIMKTSRDYDELLWAWKGWRDSTGPKMRHLFTEAVKLQNKNAKQSGYNDLSDRWLEDYEVADFEATMDSLYEQIKPLYEQLHTYIKRKLKSFYGSRFVTLNENLIPAHLLGFIYFLIIIYNFKILI